MDTIDTIFYLSILTLTAGFIYLAQRESNDTNKQGFNDSPTDEEAIEREIDGENKMGDLL